MRTFDFFQKVRFFCHCDLATKLGLGYVWSCSSNEEIFAMPETVPKNVKIYGLREPNTTIIRYVGQTCQSLSKRLYGHIEKQHNDALGLWVAGLVDAGSKPEIIKLAEVQGNWIAHKAERDWIASLSTLFGDMLFNVHFRGDFITIPKLRGIAAKHKRTLREKRLHTRWITRMCRWHDGPPRGRRVEITIEHNGEKKNLSQWAKCVGVSRERIRQRVEQCKERGADITQAITTPAGECMPCTRNFTESAYIARRERVIKEKWFDGEVHHITKNKDFPKCSTDAFRHLISTEGKVRDGKFSTRVLGDNLLVQFSKK